MLQLFRNFFKSKVGIVITLAFLGLIAVAFASSDVANTGMFGGVAGGDRVAVVGDRTISTSDLSQNVTNSLQQARGDNPTLSMEGFIAQGGFDDVIDQMLSRTAIAEFAEMLGLRAGNRLVDSEIVSAAGFQGADGNFDGEAFRNSLRQRGLSEATVREDLALSLLARQAVVPVAYQSRMPASLARTYAQLLNETRSGSAATFPAEAFAPTEDPTDEELQAYYQQNRAKYIRPERRVIRYAAFTEDALTDVPPVTDAQIAARYEADSTQFQETERRSLTQLVVPTEAAAQAVINEVNGGMSLDASAQAKGLAVTEVVDVELDEYASSASRAVATAAFGAARGALAGPVRGSLGWYVVRVDNVTNVAGRSLAQASEEIRSTIMAERRRESLNELTERLEDEFSRGRTLAEAAKELGVEIETTPPLLADGRVYGQAAEAPPELARLVSFAFEISANDATITEIVPGEAYVIFDVSEITRSATAPLAEIREDVIRQWRRERGMAAAGQAAARVLERVDSGTTLADAVREEEVSLPAAQPLRLNRQQLAEQGQINRATILFFSMAEGTAKRVAAQENGSWFVVQLDNIETGELAADSPQVQGTAAQLSSALGDEYVAQFVAAAQSSLEIERNETGIDAVRAQLTGATN
ncbi:peptidyl-prolyl isomerase [Aurantiacibacter atlanticus]|uniref:Peptidyl-prolyl isomerase n=1 Tax=Aurantiacibacter atlanticus TaxID=1648404 RepID=A0A0H4VD24_9SPHN|nr:peptidyl-prolyl cis-trans isomerase [Aurantiacibacter atlanticus]AKQ42230.1 peptidyl-prolyl isomerase [Aurantiacibacter atlanticus]MDF1833651.1 SurA N-terminal domain-containing protein [Alteraurantiacibacter sp. bin_em_oilr2.035]